MARWDTKTVTPSTDTTACPGEVTVGASWDKKGGQVDTVEFHLYPRDDADTRWLSGPDVMVVPTARDSATYTFTGLTAGTYTFTAFLLTKNGNSVGQYDGTASSSGFPC